MHSSSSSAVIFTLSSWQTVAKAAPSLPRIWSGLGRRECPSLRVGGKLASWRAGGLARRLRAWDAAAYSYSHCTRPRAVPALGCCPLPPVQRLIPFAAPPLVARRHLGPSHQRPPHGQGKHCAANTRHATQPEADGSLVFMRRPQATSRERPGCIECGWLQTHLISNCAHNTTRQHATAPICMPISDRDHWQRLPDFFCPSFSSFCRRPAVVPTPGTAWQVAVRVAQDEPWRRIDAVDKK